MRIETSGLPAGPIQNAFNALNAYLLQLRSVPLTIVADVAGLPKASLRAGQQIIVRDIDGGGTMGIATALDGAWYDKDGVSL